MGVRISVRAIICDNDEIFLCSNTYNRPACWCLPGGSLEENETLPTGLERELREEFGIEAQIGELLFVREMLDESNNSIEFFFAVDNPRAFRKIDMTKASTAHEIEAFCFIPIEQLGETKIKPEILAKLMQEVKANGYRQPTKYVGNVK